MAPVDFSPIKREGKRRWGKALIGLSALFLLCFLLLRGFAAIVYDVHYIKKGETWESIASQYGLTVQALREANKDVSELKPGEILVIPRFPSPSPSKGPPPKMAGPRKDQVGGGNPNSSKRGRANPGKPQVIGELGVVVTAPAPIRLSPSPKAPKVYTCSKGQQLIIKTKKGNWLGVLMANGSICWIHSKYVRMTGLQLIRKATVSRGRNPLGPRIVAEAMRYLGCPYKYGGTDPRTGIDCSAFVQLVFKKVGMKLPRTASEQFKVGVPVPVDQLQPGDRLYFSRSGTKIDHTGIYIGGGQFIHATSRYGRVTISSLFDPYYWRIFVGARR